MRMTETLKEVITALFLLPSYTEWELFCSSLRNYNLNISKSERSVKFHPAVLLSMAVTQEATLTDIEESVNGC